MLYMGEIVGSLMYDRYRGQRYQLERIPVKARGALDLVDWIERGPDELNRAMDADLPDALGETVGITEFYPEIERRER